MMNNAMQSYKQTQFNTLGRADLTLMLYNGAIRFLEQAQEKMLEKDMQAKGNLISRAIDIINELDASLNIQQGGDMAQRLHELYFLSTKNLLMANLKVDISITKSVQNNLITLRDVFAQAMETPEAKRMLQKMGPLPQTATSNTNIQLGGNINARAEEIKQTRERIENIEKAKNKLNNASTPEEKLRAQNEMDTLLRQAKPTIEQKIVPASLAQKAALAFIKTSAQLSPVTQVGAAPQNKTATQLAGTNGYINSSPLNVLKKTNLYANTQTTQTTQTTQVNQVNQTAQTAQVNQVNHVAQTAQTTQTAPTIQATPSTSLNQSTIAYAKNPPIVPKNTQEDSQIQNTQNTQNIPTPTTPPQSMGGLMNRKMALYKNLSHSQ